MKPHRGASSSYKSRSCLRHSISPPAILFPCILNQCNSKLVSCSHLLMPAQLDQPCSLHYIASQCQTNSRELVHLLTDLHTLRILNSDVHSLMNMCQQTQSSHAFDGYNSFNNLTSSHSLLLHAISQHPNLHTTPNNAPKAHLVSYTMYHDVKQVITLAETAHQHSSMISTSTALFHASQHFHHDHPRGNHTNNNPIFQMTHHLARPHVLRRCIPIATCTTLHVASRIRCCLMGPIVDVAPSGRLKTPSPLAFLAAAHSLHRWLPTSNHLSFPVDLYHSDSVCSPIGHTAPRGSSLWSVFNLDDVFVFNLHAGYEVELWAQ